MQLPGSPSDWLTFSSLRPGPLLCLYLLCSEPGIPAEVSLRIRKEGPNWAGEMDGSIRFQQAVTSCTAWDLATCAASPPVPHTSPRPQPDWSRLFLQVNRSGIELASRINITCSDGSVVQDPTALGAFTSVTGRMVSSVPASRPELGCTARLRCLAATWRNDWAAATREHAPVDGGCNFVFVQQPPPPPGWRTLVLLGPTALQHAEPPSPPLCRPLLQCTSANTVATGKYQGACLATDVQYVEIQGLEADTKVGGAGGCCGGTAACAGSGLWDGWGGWGAGGAHA